jgi:hypothetical protein
MAIYGVGAWHNEDVSDEFINQNFVGVGWGEDEAPELHEYFKTLKVGDIVYIKAAAYGVAEITVKAIGIIRDNQVRNGTNTDLVETGRNVVWLTTERFVIPKPVEKNNVRSNTVYEEFHPIVQAAIISRIARV